MDYVSESEAGLRRSGPVTSVEGRKIIEGNKDSDSPELLDTRARILSEAGDLQVRLQLLRVGISRVLRSAL